MKCQWSGRYRLLAWHWRPLTMHIVEWDTNKSDQHNLECGHNNIVGYTRTNNRRFNEPAISYVDNVMQHVMQQLSLALSPISYAAAF